MFEHLHDSQIVSAGYLGRGWREYRIDLKPRCTLLFHNCTAPDADLVGLWWLGSEEGDGWLHAVLVDADGGQVALDLAFDSADRRRWRTGCP